MPNQRPDPSRRRAAPQSQQPKPPQTPQQARRAAARRAARKAAARRKALLTGILCFAVLAAVSFGCFLVVSGRSRTPAPETVQPSPTPAQEPAAEPTPEPTPAMTEEEQRIADATAAAAANATKDAPVVTDPATWNERGKALMDRLSSDEFFVEQGIKVDEKEGFPYLIAVNRAASTVTVYTLDEEGRYTVPYMAMVCSGGEDTPLGFFDTPVSYA